MHRNEIDIEETLTQLWEDVYGDIIRIIDKAVLREHTITFEESSLLKSIYVTFDGAIILSAKFGISGFAENFEDKYLYDAYSHLLIMK